MRPVGDHDLLTLKDACEVFFGGRPKTAMTPDETFASAASAAIAAMPGWQPIETAPKDGQYILLVVQDRYGSDDRGGPEQSVVLSYWNPDPSGRTTGWARVRTHWKETHWMPLPAPPEVQP